MFLSRNLTLTTGPFPDVLPYLLLLTLQPGCHEAGCCCCTQCQMLISTWRLLLMAACQLHGRQLSLDPGQPGQPIKLPHCADQRGTVLDFGLLPYAIVVGASYSLSFVGVTVINVGNRFVSYPPVGITQLASKYLVLWPSVSLEPNASVSSCPRQGQQADGILEAACFMLVMVQTSSHAPLEAMVTLAAAGSF